MDFVQKIKDLSINIQKYKDNNEVENEAQTKQIFVNPFLSILGYDHTNPSSVKTEVTADFVTYNGKKVDYVLYLENKDPIILLECKHHTENLENHVKQLAHYFNNTRYSKKVGFGILTDGIKYMFFSDLDNDNLLDPDPFMVINLEKLTFSDFEYLKKFSRNYINIKDIKSFALEKKYTDNLLNYLSKEIENPSPEFSRFLKTKINFKKSNSKECFTNIIKNTFNKLIKIKSTLLINDEAKNIKFIENKEPIRETNKNSSNSEIENLKRFNKMNSDMKKKYKELEDFIFSLNLDMVMKFEKQWYTAFEIHGRYFVDFEFRPNKNSIKITVNIPLDQVTLKEGFLRDVGSIGKLSNGNIEISFTRASQLQEVKNLIKLSYENVINEIFFKKKSNNLIYTTFLSPKIKELNKIVRNFIFTLGSVDEYDTKHYIGYKKPSFINPEKVILFCATRFRKNHMNIFIKDKKGKIRECEGFIRDVSKIGHHPPANIEITFSDISQFDKIKELIHLSYNAV